MALTELEKRSLEMVRKATTDEEITQAILMLRDGEEEASTNKEDQSLSSLEQPMTSQPST